MIFFRFSIFILEEFNHIREEWLSKYNIRIYDSWNKGDKYICNGVLYCHDRFGVQLVHKRNYAINECEKNIICTDYIRFLKQFFRTTIPFQKSEIKFAATAYLSQSTRFTLLTNDEMKQMLQIMNLTVSLDIIPMSEEDMLELKNEIIEERRANEL